MSMMLSRHAPKPSKDEVVSSELSSMVGSSSAMRQLRETIERVAASDRPVLVTGPTGSGKELAVRAIHALGRHPGAPLFDLNCSAFPEALIESLLFGHERGAFTGAERRQDGYFSSVGRGSLFLDEIGEMPLSLQAKFLRVLETGTFRPVGSSRSHQFEGRVVAATHVDLEQRVANGEFREDLFYRLNVLEVVVPSLEERRHDIPELARHFAGLQPRPLSFDEAALDALCAAPWPGSVRQFKNMVDRLALLALDGHVDAEMVQLAIKPRREPCEAQQPIAQLVRGLLSLPGGDKLRLTTNALIREALRLSGGNKTAAARLLGVHRKVVERATERKEFSASDNS